jgi:hypothetical protein
MRGEVGGNGVNLRAQTVFYVIYLLAQPPVFAQNTKMKL